MTGLIKVVRPGETRTRVTRRPNFPMAGVMRPFGLYPLMAHPVLPGETLEYASSKMRVISKPVNHPLAGAWLETWLIYVKFTDLDRSLGDMFISDSFSTSGYTASGNNERTFVKTGQIDWINMCLERFHEAYFRWPDETVRTIDGVPQVKLNATSWYQNAIFHEAGVTTSTDVETAEGQITAFEMMRQMAMTELTYEKYLQQYGVSSIRTALGEPEILRYARSWVMPVNTVEPTTGAPSSAWVWGDHIELDKPKMFSEPGFVLQVAAIRPKMYMGNLASSLIGNLWGFSDWYPAYNLDDPTAGARQMDSDTNIVTGMDADVIYDHRDLLAHGEQFINSSTHPYALPEASAPSMLTTDNVYDLRGEYCTSADIDALFVDAGSTAMDRVAYYDGITNFRIKGHVRDYT